jgi:hypothetical protein
LSFLDGLPVALHTGSHYNLLTAADEKIALPVVYVNNKPQYIVFLQRLQYPTAKHGHLPVESSKPPFRALFWCEACTKTCAMRRPLSELA